MAKRKKRRFNDSKIPTERTIKTKAWRKYTDSLRMLSDKASAELEKYLFAGRTEEEALEVAHALVTKYGEASSELACQMYEALAEYSGAAVAAAEAAATATYGETARAIRGEMLRTRDAKTISSAAGRLVKLASVDTMTKNALRDGAEWAWIPSGDTCPYCLMLASKGWQRASDKIIKNGHATHIHNNCDCTFAVRLSDDIDVEGYDPDALYDEYINAGDTQWERINALRRRKYAENRDYINAQKRAAYARRRSIEEHNKGPVTAGLNSPVHFNSDEIVDEFINSIEVPNDPMIIEKIKISVKSMAKEDLDFIREKGLIVTKTSKNSAFVRSRRSRGSDGELKYVIRINSDTDEPYVFAHECAHLAEKANEIYKDDEFLEVLENLADNLDSFAVGEVDGDFYVTAISDLFIEPYQGRTYIKESERLQGRKILIEDLVEYISDGYECYVGDPVLLENKDPMLYNYFKRRGLR